MRDILGGCDDLQGLRQGAWIGRFITRIREGWHCCKARSNDLLGGGHPEEIVEASLNDVRGIAAMGAFVEHSLPMFLEGSKFKVCAEEDLKKHIDAAGIEQTILCSDLGQVGMFSPLEGFRRGVKLCIRLGYTDEQIQKMVSTNAARAFGLEADVHSAIAA
jgi:hypothetical protein